jgi:uncharacterized protein YjdB
MNNSTQSPATSAGNLSETTGIVNNIAGTPTIKCSRNATSLPAAWRNALPALLSALLFIGGATLFMSCDRGSDPIEKDTTTVAVTGIKFTDPSGTNPSLTLKIGDKKTLTVSVEPANATDKTVTWKSSAEQIATVSASGEVTAVAKGSASITATTVNGSKTAVCQVNIEAKEVEEPTTVAVTGVKFTDPSGTNPSLTLKVGDKKTLTVSVEPSNATNKTVTWKSSAEQIATVSASGEVTAVAKGLASITATTVSDSKTAVCAVNVEAEEAELPTLEVKITGAISHTTFTKGQSGTVEFNRFPATVDEWKQVREKIGGEPHGAVALQLMAYEMYRRNKTVGRECITLNNTTNNVNSAVSRLNELFGSDANYARPYQIAAFLKGATPENGYNPTKPYTVEMKVNDGRTYENFTDYQATAIYLEALTKGVDHGSQTVLVLKTKKPGEQGESGKFFIVNNCPGLYAQVKAASFENPFKGLE